MTASELRIGNWVEDENGYYQIESEHLQDEVFPYLQTWEIPLTEEWLLKFGFVTTQWDNFDSYRLEIGNNDYAIVIYSDGHCEVGDIIITKINYVHQLQNLYFALTGEEFTFKSE